jgi:hypothetical protein
VIIPAYAPPEGWYLVAAERRRMEFEERLRVRRAFSLYIGAVGETFRKMGESIRVAAEAMQPALKLLAEEQRRRERAVLSMGRTVTDVYRRAGLLPPER